MIDPGRGMEELGVRPERQMRLATPACLRRCVNVAEVRSDTGRADDVVQAQLADQRVHLHQQRQGLADAARRACHRKTYRQMVFWRA